MTHEGQTQEKLPAWLMSDTAPKGSVETSRCQAPTVPPHSGVLGKTTQGFRQCPP